MSPFISMQMQFLPKCGETEYLKKSLLAARTQRWQGKVCPATLMVKSNIKLHSRNDLSAARSCRLWDSAVRRRVWRSGGPGPCWKSDLLVRGHLLLKHWGDLGDTSILTKSSSLLKERKQNVQR